MATQSIHHRRRWFYVLWVALLLASVTALVLWETPTRVGSAKLTLHVKVRDLPSQTQVQVWLGPRRLWPGAAWGGQGCAAELKIASEKFVINSLLVPVGYRRWVKDTIPRRTADLVVLRFEAPGQAVRYLAQPIGEDWRSGLLGPGRSMTMGIECEWKGLATDPSRFSRLE